MSKTFHNWIVAQNWREDVVGDFARDAELDENVKRLKNIYQWRVYLKKIMACDGAKRALEIAYKEWASSAKIFFYK